MEVGWEAKHTSEERDSSPEEGWEAALSSEADKLGLEDG